MYRTILLFVLILAVPTSFAQTEVLTNSIIIEMSKAGLTSEIILKKVATSNTEFDVSANGLIELKRAGVSDNVISLMIERQNVLPPNREAGNTPVFSETSTTPNAFASTPQIPSSKKEIVASARTIAFEKSSLQPSRQALEKELIKRKDWQQLNLTILRYKESADLYVEIGYVSGSWITHRYVYRIYDRRSGAVIAAGETTSWGSLAENLARHIAKSLTNVRKR